MSDEEQAALMQWEEVYKRGLLTFWILLLLDEREMYAYEMRAAIAEMSQQTIDVDDNSIYRALKRFSESGWVRSDLRSSETGPPRRYFSLSESGRALLAGFIRRNLLVFQTPEVIAQMNRVLDAKNHKGK